MQQLSIENILDEIKERSPGADVGLIERAWRVAETAHKGQKRSSGENYIIHPLHTAHTLSQMNLDEATIAAALLHDVVDDTSTTIEDIERDFGKEIAFLVNGVTKLGKIKYRGIERQIENLRKMFLAMAEDIRVVLIKLADRLHNMETVGYLPERKQRRIALETLEIYAPIASRLGIGQIARSLQDLSFPMVFPDEYQWLMDNVKEEYKDREKYLSRIEPLMNEELKKEGITPLTINHRAKGYYSLYQKLLKRDMEFSRIHDLIAMRIIVHDVKECYAALGAIHKKWRPLPGLIKDYISLPKPNGYQSLHTTVFCENGKITEFQIRTPEMHQAAEYGIAAHWAYSEKGKPDKGVHVNNSRFAWVDQLKDWQKEVTGSEEFLESLKIDFFRHRIFVLTPEGEVLDLPVEATPVDFAYQIHTEVGDQAVGAKINGKMASLDSSLENGNVVEILIQKNKKPSEKWLEFVKTNGARTKIKQALRRKKIGLTPEHREARLKIYARDRVGLLRDVSTAISKSDINILNITSDAKSREILTTITVSVQIKDRTKLTRLVTKIKSVPSVEEIEHQFIG